LKGFTELTANGGNDCMQMLKK